MQMKAMAAPAAVHKLPWKFIVITEQEKLISLANGLPFAQMLKHAGAVIVVCAVPKEAAMNSEAYAILDCACASENILLAAEALEAKGISAEVINIHTIKPLDEAAILKSVAK